MNLISSLKQRSDMNHSKERKISGYSGFPLSSKTNIFKFQFDQESGRRRTTTWMCYLQIVIIYLFICSHKPLEGTRALHTVYASFFKQTSHISHHKEQAPYTLCMEKTFHGYKGHPRTWSTLGESSFPSFPYKLKRDVPCTRETKRWFC